MTKSVDNESNADAILRIAREVHPDVYKRADAIARIIAPGAFMDDWIVQPRESAELLRARLRYQQAVALSKACDVLAYLGVNTETDWLQVLDRLGREGRLPSDVDGGQIEQPMSVRTE